MIWHLFGSQHTNQIGFAVTVAYVDGRELTGEMDGLMACNECGVDVPSVHVEVMLLAWTLLLVWHAKEAA